uniref:C2H2-type domain-containing protein n=2 Tax=Lutzomyia longipalpis TaxID=7200 RepID=A0A1B0EX87_LUTLO
MDNPENPILKKELYILYDIFADHDTNIEFFKISEDNVSSNELEGNKRYLCRICNTPLDTFALFSSHMMHHLQEKKFHCRICLKNAKSFTPLLRDHLKTHSADPCIFCPYCREEFSILQHGSYEEHLLTHKEYQEQMKEMGLRNLQRMLYICNECGKIFWHPCNLQTHHFVHHTKKVVKQVEFLDYNCPYCERNFETEDEFHRHLVQKHKGRVMQNIEGMHRKGAQEVQQDDTQSEEPKEQHCQYCSAKMLGRDALKGHIRIYHREFLKNSHRPVSTRTYARSLIDLTSLQKHENHFKMLESMRNNVENRENNENSHGKPANSLAAKKEFKCIICGAIFDSKEVQEQHTWSHRIKEKRVKKRMNKSIGYYNFASKEEGGSTCPLCNVVVKEKKWLYVHIENFHKVFCIICKICGFEARSIDSLEGHEDEHRDVEEFLQPHVVKKNVQKIDGECLNISMETEKDLVDVEVKEEPDVMIKHEPQEAKIETNEQISFNLHRS